MDPEETRTFACETCAMRQAAEENPNAWKARLWRWHTKWCPSWKAYQRHLAEQKPQTGGR